MDGGWEERGAPEQNTPSSFSLPVGRTDTAAPAGALPSTVSLGLLPGSGSPLSCGEGVRSQLMAHPKMTAVTAGPAGTSDCSLAFHLQVTQFLQNAQSQKVSRKETEVATVEFLAPSPAPSLLTFRPSPCPSPRALPAPTPPRPPQAPRRPREPWRWGRGVPGSHSPPPPPPVFRKVPQALLAGFLFCSEHRPSEEQSVGLVGASLGMPCGCWRETGDLLRG